MRKLRVVHVINSFEFGGAESMLCNVLLHSDHERVESSVVTLIDDLTVADPVLKAGISITTLGMKPGVPDPRGIMRLARHLRRIQPDIVQSWMDHSNLIAGLASAFVRRTRLVWGIHHSAHLQGVAKRSTILTVRAGALLSRFLPTRIICCSARSRKMYEELGFAPDKFVDIPNGIDTRRFRPDPEARAAIRRQLSIDLHAPVVGLVARFDAAKDHVSFARAASLIAQSRKDVRFVLCGQNIDGNNIALRDLIRDCGISDRCHLLGARTDVARIYAAIDVLASSSICEAFPLTLGEAMSCGVAVAATDVGDSAMIVGPHGRIVPPSDPIALARACGEILDMTCDARALLGEAARRRICEQFDIQPITRCYESVYEQIAPPISRHEQSTECGDALPAGASAMEMEPPA